MEALFRSPGAFVHSEIEVSSHCICNTGSLRQNIIPNITQTPHHCCFIVSLLPQLSPALRALFLSSLHCHTFNHKTTREILLNGLIYFFGTFSSHLASPILARVFHRGKITEGYYKSKYLFSTCLAGCEEIMTHCCRLWRSFTPAKFVKTYSRHMFQCVLHKQIPSVSWRLCMFIHLHLQCDVSSGICSTLWSCSGCPARCFIRL